MQSLFSFGSSVSVSYPVPVNIPNIPKTKKSPQSFLRDDFLPFIKTPQIFFYNIWCEGLLVEVK